MFSCFSDGSTGETCFPMLIIINEWEKFSFMSVHVVQLWFEGSGDKHVAGRQLALIPAFC